MAPDPEKRERDWSTFRPTVCSLLVGMLELKLMSCVGSRVTCVLHVMLEVKFLAELIRLVNLDVQIQRLEVNAAVLWLRV